MWLAILLVLWMWSFAPAKAQDNSIDCPILHLDLPRSWCALNSQQGSGSSSDCLEFNKTYSDMGNKRTLSVSYYRSQPTANLIESILSKPAHELSQAERDSLKHAGLPAVSNLAWYPLCTRDFASHRFLVQTLANPMKAMTAFPDGTRGCVNLTRHSMQAILPSKNGLLILNCSLEQEGFHKQSDDIQKQLAAEMERLLSIAAWKSN